jgi:hypothetical protein
MTRQPFSVSYAHADDKIPHGATSGWVTTFVDQLNLKAGWDSSWA